MSQPGSDSLQSRLQEAARHHTVLDVGGQRVARVYAEALLGAADKRNQTEEVLEELGSLVEDLFAADPDFEAFLVSGAVGRHPKADLIQRALGGRASDLLVNFLLVLNEHERLGIVRAILAEARQIRDRRAGRMRVEVRSAVPLPDDQRERLLHQLRDTFHREPVLETRVDPDLIGGLVVQVGDWLYDASIRTRLASIRNQLLESSSHEIQTRRDRFGS